VKLNYFVNGKQKTQENSSFVYVQVIKKFLRVRRLKIGGLVSRGRSLKYLLDFTEVSLRGMKFAILFCVAYF